MIMATRLAQGVRAVRPALLPRSWPVRRLASSGTRRVPPLPTWRRPPRQLDAAAVCGSRSASVSGTAVGCLHRAGVGATPEARAGGGRMLHSAVGGGLRHDHSKGIVGRDDGSGHRRDDWWEERAEISEDAAEVKFNLVLASGRSTIELVGKVGESIEDVAKRNGHVEGACDGNCQCSTCHIFIPKESDRQRLGMPGSVEDFEVDMLELARDYDADPEGSRLSCQIILTEKLEGLTIKLPNGTTNYMDHLPFE